MHCLWGHACDSFHASKLFFTPHNWCFECWHAGAPLVDVVFVHGIRGGAFATWRREGVQNVQPGHKAGNLDHLYCWPSTWLPQDVPQARLLSMEYAAPASGWEVSHSLLHSLPHCYQCIPSPPAETCMSCPPQALLPEADMHMRLFVLRLPSALHTILCRNFASFHIMYCG